MGWLRNCIESLGHGTIMVKYVKLLQTRDVSKVKSEAGLFETFEEHLEEAS